MQLASLIMSKLGGTSSTDNTQDNKEDHQKRGKKRKAPSLTTKKTNKNGGSSSSSRRPEKKDGGEGKKKKTQESSWSQRHNQGQVERYASNGEIRDRQLTRREMDEARRRACVLMCSKEAREVAREAVLAQLFEVAGKADLLTSLSGRTTSKVGDWKEALSTCGYTNYGNYGVQQKHRKKGTKKKNKKNNHKRPRLEKEPSFAGEATTTPVAAAAATTATASEV